MELISNRDHAEASFPWARHRARGLRFCGLLVLLLLSCLSLGRAQQPGQSLTPQNSANAIRSQSNVVLVRVIVRDAHGNPVTGLTQRDFKLFDNKKEQVISYFQADARANPSGEASTAPDKNKSSTAAAPPAAAPQRFAALFFDDYHMAFGDLAQVREAARRYLRKNLDAGERVAIFSASGKPQVEFTSDWGKLEQGLSQVNFNRRFEPTECPKLTPYFAQLVADDMPEVATGGGGSAKPQLAVSAGTINTDKPLSIAEAMAGQQRCPVIGPDADEDMHARAENIVFKNDLGVQETLIALSNLVRRMSETLGGTRTIAVMSGGFFSRNLQNRIDKLIDRALRADVVVNTLDARGLYAEPPGGDLSELSAPPEIERKIEDMKHTGMATDSDALNEIAEATGGVFVENSNDMEGGIAKISALRAPAYVLGFSPENLKSNGRFHSLRVNLTDSRNFSIQARRGYFAPATAPPTGKAERENLEEAAFSQESLNGFPLHLNTKSRKIAVDSFNLSITVDADMRSAQFIKKGDRNIDDLTVLVVLFDQDGNYVTGRQQTVKLRLQDGEFEALRHSGGETTVDLTVKPGTYIVRAVMGDTDSNQLGAVSGNLRIP